jgi:BolA protein
LVDEILSRTARIEQALRAAFSPETLTVADDSASHADHNPVAVAGETHLTLVIASAAFQGMPRVKRHQAIYAVLEKELSSGLHALSIHALTPEEAAKR